MGADGGQPRARARHGALPGGERLRLRTRAVYTNDTPAGAFRGFGVPQAAIAHETLMDDLAERLGLDRWAIRRLNALRPRRRHAVGPGARRIRPACRNASTR